MDPNHITKNDNDDESKSNDSNIDRTSDEEEQLEQYKNDNDNSDISSKNSGGKNDHNNDDTMMDDSDHDKDRQDDDEESTSHDESVDDSSDNDDQDDSEENATSSSDGENNENDKITNNSNNINAGSNGVNNEDKQKSHGEINQSSNKSHSNLNGHNHESTSMKTTEEKYDQQQAQPKTSQSHQPFQHTSIEALLSVPLDFIFRKTNQDTTLASTSKSTTSLSKKRKHNQQQHTNHNHHQHQQQQQQQFLLSKTEAMTFIQITNLAHELDCLVQMATNAIYKSHVTKKSSVQLSKLNTSTPYYHNLLHPIHVLLKIHGETIPNQILEYVQSQMERILLIEFPSICQVLHQCSEQNWSVSNALVMSITQQQQQQEKQNTIYRLGKEKGILAEIEEELCNRINGLIEMTMDGNNSFSSNGHHHNGDSDMNVVDQDIFDKLTKTINNKSNASSDENDEFTSMAKLCQKLLNESKEEVNNTDHVKDQDDNEESETNQDVNGNSALVSNDITSSQLFAVDALSKLSSWGT